jgi:Cd(II)/Pb(II)-responsive transcriptional regulator
MRIGELAQSSGTPVETIRFYERQGLLPPAARTHGNYRIYTALHAGRLAFIWRCRRLDMTLDEVRVLLRLKDKPQPDCSEVNSLLDEHIDHVAERVRASRALEKELRELRADCVAPQAGAACGIIHGMDPATAKPATAHKRHVRGAH